MRAYSAPNALFLIHFSFIIVIKGDGLHWTPFYASAAANTGFLIDLREIEATGEDGERSFSP